MAEQNAPQETAIDSSQESPKTSRRRGLLIGAGLIVLAIVLALFLRGCTAGTNNWFTFSGCLASTSSASASSSPSPAKPALGAYELWLKLGNKGTEQDFLNSLVGKPGKNGYVGSDGQVGADGKAGASGVAGASAYQLWLNSGHTGSPQDFLDSLVGADGVSPSATAGPVGPSGSPGSQGAAGIAGLSAYELWLAEGNEGTTQDFFDSLAGVAGSAGADGTPGQSGLSAYEIWLSKGNTGTESDFLISLVGAAGTDGAPGVCTVGETGAQGPSGAAGSPGANGTNGMSAYEIWLSQGNSGTELQFLASLKGPAGTAGQNGIDGLNGVDGSPGASGAPGTNGTNGTNGLSAYEVWLQVGNIGSEAVFLASLVGPTGPQGPAGPAGTSGLGDSGSFWDDTVQGQLTGALVGVSANAAHPMYFGQADTTNNQGVSITKCADDVAQPAGYPVDPKSCITFTHSGVYNIAFSAQLYRQSGGNQASFSIWLAQNDGTGFTNTPDTNTDVSLVANGTTQVAAWNFFAPVTCTTNGATHCTQYRLMWSHTSDNIGFLAEAAQTAPARPSIPSIILTVNQVK